MLVVDCDYPQWSIHTQRGARLSLIEHDDYHKLLLIRQFKATDWLWPLLAACRPKPPKKSGGGCKATYHPRIILYHDLPGTINAERRHSAPRVVGRCLRAPESRQGRHGKCALLLPGASLLTSPRIRPSLYGASIFFWTMIDRRERTPLYADTRPLSVNSGCRLWQLTSPTLEVQQGAACGQCRESALDAAGAGTDFCP